MKMGRLQVFFILASVALAGFNSRAEAQQVTVIPQGATVDVNVHGVCRRVTNHAYSPALTVPWAWANEWHVGGESFLAQVPAGVGVAPCGVFCPHIGAHVADGICGTAGNNPLLIAHTIERRVTWDTARSICASRGGGWALPSLSQLRVLYPNRNILGFHNSQGTYIWSSEMSGGSAHYKGMHNQSNGYEGRIVTYNGNYASRCVKQL